MKKEEIKTELEAVMKFTSTKGDNLTRLYTIYRLVYNDNGYICDKCPTVIRGVFMKIKNYYNKTYK